MGKMYLQTFDPLSVMYNLSIVVRYNSLALV